MIITHKIKIDLSSSASPARIEVAQEDKYSRDVEISLYAAGLAWQIPEGASALFRYEKADGKGGSYNVMPDESAAFSVAGNKITVKLAPQVCSTPGPVAASVALMSGTTEVNTFPFTVHVRRTPGVNAVSEDYVNVNGLLPASGWNPGLVLRTDENGNVVAEDNFRRIYVDVDLNFQEDATIDLTENYGETIKKALADVLQARSLQLWVSDTTNGIATASILLDDIFAPPSEDGDLIVIAGLMPNPLSGSGSKFELHITEKPGAIPSVILQYTANIGGSGSGSGLTPEQAAQIQANTDAIAALPITVNADTGYTEIENLPRAISTVFTKDGATIAVTTTLEDGREGNGTLTLDDITSYPVSYTEDGLVHTFEFVGFDEEDVTTEEGSE
ncbi:MAG: hypothetical protein IJN67_11700 [Oscillospiraceae bacterium]|nr:hypothetical protein [Oscillospiraceae bacterium]